MSPNTSPTPQSRLSSAGTHQTAGHPESATATASPTRTPFPYIAAGMVLAIIAAIVVVAGCLTGVLGAPHDGIAWLVLIASCAVPGWLLCLDWERKLGWARWLLIVPCALLMSWFDREAFLSQLMPRGATASFTVVFIGLGLATGMCCLLFDGDAGKQLGLGAAGLVRLITGVPMQWLEKRKIGVIHPPSRDGRRR